MRQASSDKIAGDLDLQAFLQRMPPPDAIRARIARNAGEISVLKRLLKVAEQQAALPHTERGARC